MTLAYELERLRVALEAVETAAATLARRELPEWMVVRLAHIRDEGRSMRECLNEHKEGETK